MPFRKVRLVTTSLALCVAGAAPSAAVPGSASPLLVPAPRFGSPFSLGGFDRFGKSHRKLYVANHQGGVIDIYPAGVLNPKPIGEISKGVEAPVDVYVDAAGTVYVANQDATATVYPAGQSSPSRTLQVSVEPQYITAGHDGTIFVLGTDSKQNSRIEEFDPGAKSPSRHIEYPSGLSDPVFAAGLATDKHGNLYVNVGALSGNSNFAVAVYAPKRVKPFTYYSSGGDYAYGGIEVDEKDRLIVGDPYDQYVDVQQLPKGGSLRYIPNAQSGDYLALDPDSNYLYTVSLGSSTLQIYDFKTGKALGLLHGFEGGIAVGPGPD